MIDWNNSDESKKLGPIILALQRFESLEFYANVAPNGWVELAIVLAEESGFRQKYAEKIISAFLVSQRFDQKGQPRFDVPSAPELRAFARKMAASDPPDGKLEDACQKCASSDGRWQIVERNGVEVPVACDCPRGLHLARRREAEQQRRIV